MPDLPVEPDQLAVDRKRGPSPGSPDSGLDLGQELRVVRRQRVAPGCGCGTSHTNICSHSLRTESVAGASPWRLAPGAWRTDLAQAPQRPASKPIRDNQQRSKRLRGITTTRSSHATAGKHERSQFLLTQL